MRIGSLRVLQPPKVALEKPEESATSEQNEKPEVPNPVPDTDKEKGNDVTDKRADDEEMDGTVAKDGDGKAESPPKSPVASASSSEAEREVDKPRDASSDASKDEPALPSTAKVTEESGDAVAENDAEEKEGKGTPSDRD